MLTCRSQRGWGLLLFGPRNLKLTVMCRNRQFAGEWSEIRSLRGFTFKLRIDVARGHAEIGSHESQLGGSGCLARNWQRASRQDGNQTTEIEILNPGTDSRGSVLPEGNGGVTVGVAVQRCDDEIVQLNLIAGGHEGRVRRPEGHLTQNTAAQTEVGTGAISSRRFDREDRPREFDVFDAAIFQSHVAGVDVIS